MKKFGIILLAAGAMLAIPVNIADTSIIIHMGIHAYKTLSVLAYVILVSGGGLVLTGFAKKIILNRRLEASKTKVIEQQRENSRPVLSYTATSYDPADIRHRLEGIAQQRPDLTQAIGQCHLQMDEMDKRQMKLKELLDLNDAEYLRNTESLLNDVEQFICKNFRKVINRCVVSDIGDDQVFSKDNQYETDIQLINAALQRNQCELDNIKKFLADLADLISEENNNPETTLEVWMDIIRKSLQKEGDF